MFWEFGVNGYRLKFGTIKVEELPIVLLLLFNWSCTADFCSCILIRDNLWNELNPTLASCTFFPKSGQIPPWKPIPQRLHKIFLIFQGNGYRLHYAVASVLVGWGPMLRSSPVRTAGIMHMPWSTRNLSQGCNTLILDIVIWKKSCYS